MFKTRLVLMVLLVAFVAAPVQASYGPIIWSDNMDDIAATGWTDLRDGPGQGAGWLHQNETEYTEGTGSLGVDYSKTYNHDETPPYLLENPLALYDYQGNNVGTPAGTFDVDENYLGDFDREISRPTGPGFPNLVPGTHIFVLDVYRSPVAAGYANPEHIRELQLYDSLGARNTYQVMAEATASFQPVGWSTVLVDLVQVFEDNADLSDITKITFWFSAWSAYVSGPGDPPVWPDDYTIVRPVGGEVKIDDLRIIPEPATMTLLALGGLALLRRRKA